MGQTGKGSGTASSPAGGKSLSDLKTICQYHGWSQTHTEGLAELTNFINDTLQMLGDLAPWPEYHKLDGTETFDADDDTETLTETNIIRVGTVVKSGRSVPLTYITPEEWLFNKRYHAGSGSPSKYTLRKYTSSGTIKVDMYLYPRPSAETTVYYTYQISPTILVDNSDTTDWPNTRMWLLTEALRIRLAAIDRDAAGVALYSPDFIGKVNTAFNRARPNYMPIIAKPLTWTKPGKWTLKDIKKTFA